MLNYAAFQYHLLTSIFEHSYLYISIVFQAWHSFAYASYEAVQQYKGLQKELSSSNLQEAASAAPDQQQQQQVTPTRPSNGAPNVDIIKFCVDAVDGFFKSISLSDGNSLQDTLRSVAVCS